VTDSVVTGGTTGIEVGSQGDLTLTQAVVTGSSAVGTGLQLSTGTVSATASTIRGGALGVRFVPGGSAGATSHLVLDNSSVQGETGSAIVVNDFGLAPIFATVDVNNGSTLAGGNGKILEVEGVSTANMTVDNSHLVGDVVAGSGATTNITLQNQSTLTGRLENVSQLTVNSDARWVMVGELTTLRSRMIHRQSRVGSMSCSSSGMTMKPIPSRKNDMKEVILPSCLPISGWRFRFPIWGQAFIPCTTSFFLGMVQYRNLR
jgi:hypothetical protein